MTRRPHLVVILPGKTLRSDIRTPIIRGRTLTPSLTTTTTTTLQAPLLLEIDPSFHRDLAAIELALDVAVAAFFLVARRLARVAPGKVVEFPVRVGRQDAVPDGQGEEVDQHPADVGEAVGCHDDEEAWETQNEAEEDERDG